MPIGSWYTPPAEGSFQQACWREQNKSPLASANPGLKAFERKEVPMRRRETFALLSGFALIAVTACGGGDDDSAPNDSTKCDGAGATTTNVSGHTHFVCVALADLNSPPADGKTYVTTNNSGHTHSITLTAAQLTSIAGGESVSVTTTNDAGHTHAVTLVK
jgi:hypothetical protein